MPKKNNLLGGKVDRLPVRQILSFDFVLLNLSGEKRTIWIPVKKFVLMEEN